MKAKILQTSGKRKRAIARASLKSGTGNITINNLSLDYFEPKFARMKIKEPLLLVKNIADKVDIKITVHGGGVVSQADAVRLAIGRAFVKFDEKIKDVLLNYDRQLLVADVRRKEVSKPNSQGKARAKRQKSYR
ncbi:30S ribosomal protein S9 [Candidatus Woesearchaeota archaeon]|mgnify:CR=1 FL=1|jgi:small subunit ribosomal protein S9|nr:30S ribosomal protein S9 [Candidatus Woesearchaeota archaeon]|tara:strand:- start:1785 stop:2186 length:402 start_codon:yes stop_codon:yes gene_type:complete